MLYFFSLSLANKHSLPSSAILYTEEQKQIIAIIVPRIFKILIIFPFLSYNSSPSKCDVVNFKINTTKFDAFVIYPIIKKRGNYVEIK